MPVGISGLHSDFIFRNKLFTLLVLSGWGKVFSLGERGTVVTLLHSSSASTYPTKSFPTVKVGCSPPLMRELQHSTRGFQITSGAQHVQSFCRSCVCVCVCVSCVQCVNSNEMHTVSRGD